MSHVLIFGKGGQLSTELERNPWPAGWRVSSFGVPETDLSVPGNAAPLIREHRPAMVVNAAAYTAVDKAESEIAIARAVNAAAPAEMARACADLDIPFITVSTDYVFDGSKTGDYVEDDPVSPLGAYGVTKEEGERLVREACERHLILRTSWVFSACGNNFVRTMLRLGAERPVLRVVADQRGKPTSAADLARAIIRSCSAIAGGSTAFGTYHVSNAGPTTWHGFATAIFDGARLRGARVPERVEPITTAEYPTPAKRPANSVLATAKFERTFATTIRPWQAALDEVLDELLPRQAAAGGAG